MTFLNCSSNESADSIQYREHDDYKRHIKNLINSKAAVNNKEPDRFTHIRPKTFKEDMFKN